MAESIEPTPLHLEVLDTLMQRYAAGEDDAFERLYALLAPRLHRFCLRLTGRKAEAEDLLQDTFLRLHRARATYLGGASTLYWAFAIARSAHLDQLRRRRRRPEELGLASDAAQDDRVSADERYSPEAEARALYLLQIVTLELDNMSERNRTAYILIREEGLSVRQAASVLGTSTDVVKKRAHRAYEQIRAAVTAAGWTEEPRARFLHNGLALADALHSTKERSAQIADTVETASQAAASKR